MIRGRIRAAACGSAPMLPFILRDTGIDRSGKSHYNTEGKFLGVLRRRSRPAERPRGEEI